MLLYITALRASGAKALVFLVPVGTAEAMPFPSVLEVLTRIPILAGAD